MKEHKEKANNLRWVVLASTSLGTFLSVVNGNIVHVALPTMGEEFGVGLSIIQWVILVYLLVVSAVLPIVGRLADMFGRKLVYSSGIIIVIVGAVASALAESFWLLIAARVVMAVGAAMPMANGMAIVTSVFPAVERGKALGIVSSMVALGLMSGPVVGGFLVSWGGYSWVFLVNIPLGLLALFTGLYFLPADKPKERQEPFDFLGAVLFATGMFSLLLVVSQAQEWGFFSPATIIIGVVTIVLLISFWRVEKRIAYPLIDFDLFKIRPLFIGIMSSFLLFLAIAAIAILTPFYLQEILGYPPDKAGLYMLPFPLAMSVVSPLSGYLSDRMSTAILPTAGLLLCALGLSALASIQPGQGNGLLLACFGLIGFGVGVFQSPNNSSIMGAVPSYKLGLANGLSALVRNLGHVIGTALMVGVFTVVNDSYLLQVSSAGGGETAAFMAGWRVVFFLAAGLAATGAVVSSLRYKTRKPDFIAKKV